MVVRLHWVEINKKGSKIKYKITAGAACLKKECSYLATGYFGIETVTGQCRSQALTQTMQIPGGPRLRGPRKFSLIFRIRILPN